MKNLTKRLVKKGIVKKVNDNSISVEVISTYPNRIYKKVVSKEKQFVVYFNSKTNSISVGDSVSIISCRPLSSKISWRLYNK